MRHSKIPFILSHLSHCLFLYPDPRASKTTLDRSLKTLYNTHEAVVPDPSSPNDCIRRVGSIVWETIERATSIYVFKMRVKYVLLPGTSALAWKAGKG